MPARYASVLGMQNAPVKTVEVGKCASESAGAFPSGQPRHMRITQAG